jgi:hypothetical protein
MSEMYILAFANTQAGAHMEALDVWAINTQCLQRDPQLGSPAGGNTRYDPPHNTFQLKQKGVAASQSVVRS